MDFKPAQKVEIIKSSDTFERWQVIAFKSTKGSHSIKRIVGLPGEKISFSDGDLLVNGKRVRRGIQIQEQMAIPVFDSSYVLLDRISYSGFEDDSVQQHSYQAAYTHFRAYRSNDFEAKRESIVDSYSFNQFLKRDLFPVRDLMVKLDIELQPYLDGWELSIHDGASWLTWRLQYGSLELSFLVDDHRVQVWENVQLVPRFDRHFEIVCSNFDRFAYISFKNQEFLSGPFERSKPIPNPPATCVRFSSPNYLTINKFLLFRDLHYSTENNAAEWKLDNNEYFVVGDNVPVSIDSRHSSFGFVKASQIIGVVRPACSED